MTRQKRTTDVPAPPPTDGRDIAFYSAVVNAWITTRIEKDKSVLTLAVAGIGLLATLLAAVGVRTLLEIPFYAIGFSGFLIASWTAVQIFDQNAEYLGKLAKDEDCEDPALSSLDRRLMYSFLCGVSAVLIIGSLSAFARYHSGVTPMANEKKPSIRIDTFQKSLNTLNQLRNDSSGKTTASVDGLHKLKPTGLKIPAPTKDSGKPKK